MLGFLFAAENVSFWVLEGCILFVSFLRKHKMAGEILQVSGPSNKIIAVVGGRKFLLFHILVFVLRLPLPCHL